MEKSCTNCRYFNESFSGPHCGSCCHSEHSNWEEWKLPSPPADYLDYFRHFPKFSLPIFKNDAICRIDTDSIKVNKEDNMNNKPRNHKFIKTNTKERKIKEVMFNGPATIIKWEPTMHDYAYGKTKGDKTVSVCGEGDIYDKEKGFLLAVIKEFVDNQSYDNILRMMDSFNDDPEGENNG